MRCYLVNLRAPPHASMVSAQVESADEWGRIRAARRTQERSNRARSRDEAVGAAVPHPQTTGLGPASVVVRLAMPVQSRKQAPDGSAAASTVADFSGAVEASYGAREEDVVEIVQAAMAAAKAGQEHGGVGKHSMPSTPSVATTTTSNSSSSSSSSLPIVGFSIDVGPACFVDALAGHASVPPPFGQGRSDASRAALDAETDATGLGPGEAMPSAFLAESIDAAVSFAVKMAGVAAAAAAAAAAITSTTAAAPGGIAEDETLKHREIEGRSVANDASAPGSPTAAKATFLGSSISSPSPFCFRRLHVTGLGEGGARGEPLAALKAALSRHLPPTVATAAPAASSGSNGGGSWEGASRSSAPPVGRPIVVSADATEHLAAGGVWSTVASIIGRKSVPPAAANDDLSPQTRSPTKDGVVGGSVAGHGGADAGAEAGCRAAGEGVGEEASTPPGASEGGAMYYIDDGCYGSLSGALLRGVQMQPLPLRAKASMPRRSRDSAACPSTGTAAGETSCSCREDERGIELAQELPCTVWGPTCDGLDCVCRMTPLPDDMEPGRDWLFFPDVGIRGGADATDFNGLKPLGVFYCVRQREEVPPSRAPAPAPALPPMGARVVSP